MLAVCVEDVEEGHLKKLDDQVQKHDEDGFFGSTEIKPQPLTWLERQQKCENADCNSIENLVCNH